MTSLSTLLILTAFAPAGDPSVANVRLETDMSGLPETAARSAMKEIEDGLAEGGVVVDPEAGTVMRVEYTVTEADTVVDITVRTGERINAESRDVCEICGQSELDQLTEDLVARVVARLAAQQTLGILRVSGTPTGAEVYIDDELAGTTPLDVELQPGSHRVEVRSQGRDAQAYEFDAIAGVEETFTYSLHHEGADGQEDETIDRGKGFRIGGWALLAAGLGAVGGGAALWAIDGRSHQPSCAPELVDINGVCPQVFVTKAGGIGLVAGGVAAIGGAVPLLVIGHKRKGQATGDVSLRGALAPGFTGVTLRGRF